MASSVKTIPAPDLGALLEALLDAGVNFILVGGLAAVVQGAPLTTMDADIVHQCASDNIERLADLLESLQAVYRRPDDKTIPVNKDDLSGRGHLLLSTRLGPLDVLAFIENQHTYDDLIAHTVPIAFRGRTLRVLSLGKLVELKNASRHPKDRQQLAVLEETLRQVKGKPGM